jgi:hypothetical protein
MSSSPVPSNSSDPIRSADDASAVEGKLSQVGWRSYLLAISAGTALLVAILFPIWALRNLKIDFPPIIGDDVAVTTRNQPVDINVVMNDADPIGLLNLKSVKIERAPGHGEVTSISDMGVVTYVPNPEFVGQDVLMYTVRNEDGARSSFGMVKITVNP